MMDLTDTAMSTSGVGCLPVSMECWVRGEHFFYSMTCDKRAGGASLQFRLQYLQLLHRVPHHMSATRFRHLHNTQVLRETMEEWKDLRLAHHSLPSLWKPRCRTTVPSGRGAISLRGEVVKGVVIRCKLCEPHPATNKTFWTLTLLPPEVERLDGDLFVQDGLRVGHQIALNNFHCCSACET